MEKPDFSSMMDKLSEWLNDQPWFQQLKAKWDELDAQSRAYLKLAGAGACLFGLGFFFLNFMWSVHALRKEVNDKSEILSLLQSSNDELKRLRDVNAGLSQAEATAGSDKTPEPWPGYIENTGNTAGIAKNSLTVSEPKSGTTNDVAKEALFDIAVKKVSIRQLVRFAQSLESGARPVKLRNLQIDTQPDGTGYLDATISISAFTLVSSNK